MSYNIEQLDQVGKNIRRRRKEKRLTQENLADSLGITNKQISKYEKSDGHTDFPPLENLIKICNELECELGYLLGEKEYVAGTKEETIVQEYTGLSHESLCAIREISGKEKSKELSFRYNSEKSNSILNNLLSSPVFIDVIVRLMELEKDINEYKRIIPNAIEEVGQEAWDEAFDLEKSLEHPLYTYGDDDKLGLSDNQIRAMQLIDESIDRQCDCVYKIKVSRYDLHELLERLVEDLYPRLYGERNSLS